MNKKIVFLLISITFGWTGTTHAGLTGFTDRTAFEVAIGGSNGSEDFSSFLTDADFTVSSVAANNMTISGDSSVDAPITNKIDASPLEVSGIYSNGTSYLFGQLFLLEQIRIDFIRGVTAWGGDFNGAANANAGNNTSIQVFSSTDLLLGSLQLIDAGGDAGFTSFNGFNLNAGEVASYIILQNSNPNDNDAFGLDDIAFKVPAPATLALFGIGLAGLGWSRRKKA